ncbi:MAG: GFA family protein, partial [Steroidobacteraceae bacterium]
VMAQQTTTGACHCGKVRIELDVDLAAGTSRCNCSICGKVRAWTAIVKPPAFRLLGGQDDLGSYEISVAVNFW